MSDIKKKSKRIKQTIKNMLHGTKYCVFVDNPNEIKYVNLSNNAEFFKVISHLKKEHPNHFSLCCVMFDINITSEDLEEKKVLRKLNDLYLVEVCIKHKQLYVKVNRLNKCFEDIFERFTIEINSESKSLTKYGCVSKYRELLTEFIATPIAGLKTVFKNEKNLKLTCTIQSYNQCKHCEHLIEIKNTKYIMREGWYCFKCSNMIEFGCRNWHCNYRDIYEKQKKHNLFFCTERSICFICREQIERNPVQHYISQHQQITYDIGTPFLISKTEGQYCFLKYGENEEHFLVCRYHFNDNEIQFAVRSPWTLQEIKKFRCYITLQPLDKSYEMLKCLYEFDDWRINLQKCIFENSEELFIIIRIESNL